MHACTAGADSYVHNSAGTGPGSTPIPGFYGVVIATDDYGIVHCGLHVDSNQNPADDVTTPNQGSAPAGIDADQPAGVIPGND